MECAHEPCTCRTAQYGDVCSESCRMGIKGSPFCGCEHPECEASLAGAEPLSETGPI
jgi:hypothetical protein